MYLSVLLSLLLSSIALAAPKRAHRGLDVPSPANQEFYGQFNTRDAAASAASYAALPVVEIVTVTAVPSTIITVTSSNATVSSAITVAPTTIITLPSISTNVSTSATPPVSTGTAVPVDEPAGVYVCSDTNWGGTCEHKLTQPGGSDMECTPLSGTESSIGPDPGFLCEFYTNAVCRRILTDGSDFLELTYPGIADLRQTPKGDLNDAILSYLCFRVV